MRVQILAPYVRYTGDYQRHEYQRQGALVLIATVYAHVC